MLNNSDKLINELNVPHDDDGGDDDEDEDINMLIMLIMIIKRMISQDY